MGQALPCTTQLHVRPGLRKTCLCSTMPARSADNLGSNENAVCGLYDRCGARRGGGSVTGVSVKPVIRLSVNDDDTHPGVSNEQAGRR